MSTMNPLKFVGGMILEIGAVVAVLAILPAMGTRDAAYSSPVEATSGPNQVFFDASSTRVIDDRRVEPRKLPTWHSDLVPLPPESQQRYVENTLDHSSQRALDAAMRVWNQGDRLLPPELRVGREDVAPPTTSRGYIDNGSRPSHYSAPASRFDGRY